MSAASRGHARERQVRKLLDSEGWWTARAAGSLGDADIIALRCVVDAWDVDILGQTVEALLVEVKTDVRGPFAHFGPAHRAELLAAAQLSGARPMLCWWPARKQPQWIGPEEWPTTNDAPTGDASHPTQPESERTEYP